MGLDKGAGHNKTAAATIKSVAKDINGDGAMMERFAAKKYTGKRIRLTAYMRTTDVAGHACFWMRVNEEKSDKPLAIDDMQDRPITGTMDWQKYAIVLNVPDNASTIAFGATLSGTGQIWMDDMSFEVVNKSVHITGQGGTGGIPNDPVNLDFEQ